MRFKKYKFLNEVLAAGFNEIHQVAPGFYRGSQPDFPALQELKAIGIRTVISLNDIAEEVMEEEKDAESLGLTFYNFPINPCVPVNKEEIDMVLSLLGDSSKYPLYIHCEYGQDRTGLLVGLFRVLRDGWTPEDAYREMLIHNFHPQEIFLEQAFWILVTNPNKS